MLNPPVDWSLLPEECIWQETGVNSLNMQTITVWSFGFVFQLKVNGHNVSELSLSDASHKEKHQNLSQTSHLKDLELIHVGFEQSSCFKSVHENCQD